MSVYDSDGNRKPIPEEKEEWVPYIDGDGKKSTTVLQSTKTGKLKSVDFNNLIFPPAPPPQTQPDIILPPDEYYGYGYSSEEF